MSVTGRLTKNAEMKLIGAKQTPCAEFTVANNTGYGQYEKCSYIDVQLWGASGENLLKYLTKGKQVAVSGEFVQSQWVDQNGGKHSSWRLSTRNVTLLASSQGSKQSSSEPEPAPDYNSEEVAF